MPNLYKKTQQIFKQYSGSFLAGAIVMAIVTLIFIYRGINKAIQPISIINPTFTAELQAGDTIRITNFEFIFEASCDAPFSATNLRSGQTYTAHPQIFSINGSAEFKTYKIRVDPATMGPWQINDCNATIILDNGFSPIVVLIPQKPAEIVEQIIKVVGWYLIYGIVGILGYYYFCYQLKPRLLNRLQLQGNHLDKGSIQ